jgi:alpha-mannosidase
MTHREASIVALILCWLMAGGALSQEPVRIYLGNDDHTDMMWSADQATYENAFVDMLYFHLDLADQTAANAPPYRNRFNADGSH